MIRCRTCVLSSQFPTAAIGKDGLCRYCREAPEAYSELGAGMEKRFNSYCRRVKGKRQYDVLAAFSGGKDSAYTLYLLVKKYRLKVLAYTLDNGFIPKEVKQNIYRVTEALGCDRILYRPDDKMRRRLFRSAAQPGVWPVKTKERSSLICAACITTVKTAAIQIGRRHNAPMIAFGWTPGQSPVQNAFMPLSVKMTQAITNLSKSNFKHLIGAEPDYLYRHSDSSYAPAMVHPAAYRPATETSILKTIKKLGWKKPAGLDPTTTNCRLNALGIDLHYRSFGFHPYEWELSGLIRMGLMSRSHALKRLARPSKKIVDTLKGELA